LRIGSARQSMERIDCSHLPEFDNHKVVYRFEELSAGLRGFIAIHNDYLGPATGGTRMYPYASEEDALRDVLKLSRTVGQKEW
jgi:leucine dehydrogenase